MKKVIKTIHTQGKDTQETALEQRKSYTRNDIHTDKWILLNATGTIKKMQKKK